MKLETPHVIIADEANKVLVWIKVRGQEAVSKAVND